MPTQYLWRKRDGYVLITALIALGVMALIGLGVLGLAHSSLRASRQAVESEQAFYMANAGVEWAMAHVQSGAPLTNGSHSMTVDAVKGIQGSYSVTVTPVGGGAYQLVSTGVVGGSTRKITARLDPPPPAAPPQVYTRAVASNGNLLFGNNALICGDIYGRSKVEMGNNSEVLGTPGDKCASVTGNGKLVSTTTFVPQQNVVVEGGWCDSDEWGPGHPCTSQPAPVELEYPDFQELYDEADLRHTGSVELQGSMAFNNQIVYVPGSLSVDTKGVAISGTVTFYSPGDIEINGDVTCATPGCQVVFISQGTIEIWNNTKVWASLITTGSVVAGNGPIIHGNVQAGQFQAGNNVELYPIAMEEVVQNPPPGLPEGSGPTGGPTFSGWSN